MPVDGLDDLEVLLDAGRLVLRLNRPDALNALTPAMLATAADRIRAASHDPGIRVVVITGLGRAFCSGADIAADGGTELTGTLDSGRALVDVCRWCGYGYRRRNGRCAVVRWCCRIRLLVRKLI